PRQRLANLCLGGDEFRGRPHHIADPMTVGIAVDTPQGALRIDAARALDRLDPPGTMLLIEHMGERTARLYRLSQRPDAARAQLGHECAEDARSRHCIAQRGMAVLDLHAEPGREPLERETGKIGLGDLRQQTSVEGARSAETRILARAFVLEYS